MEKTFRIIVPTLNPGQHSSDQVRAFQENDIDPDSVLIIDSSSDDNSIDVYRDFGAKVITISRSDFNHGTTRAYAVEQSLEYDFLVYLTQDAKPEKGFLTQILANFDDPEVGLAYGRQMPRLTAGSIERFARLFNYPETAETRTLKDKDKFGIKTCFCSNSFCAYRTSVLVAVGNFPNNTFFAEDQIVATKMLELGCKIVYDPDAKVVHSHKYTLVQDFKRYFDVGVFHSRNKWITDQFQSSEKKGMSFITSEARYLSQNNILKLPEAFARNVSKYLGYRLGKMERHLSISTKKKLSMNSFYWKSNG